MAVSHQKGFIKGNVYPFALPQYPALPIQFQQYRKENQRTADMRAIGKLTAHKRPAHIQVA